VGEVIGVGGFSTVYRASDERLGVDVAVKVLAENHSLDADVRERFVEEGRRLRRVGGPHLLAVHDIGDTDRAQPYLVLDLADRGDLAGRVATLRKQGRRPGPADILLVGRAVARALAALHHNRLVHRDLAPKNLLLCSTTSWSPAAEGPARLIAVDERLVLADLGLSKDLAVASGLTVAGGTSGFAPPEQREHGRAVDHRADIWAASALVLWLALDRTPDDAGGWRDDLGHQSWPPGLVRLLARGLAPRPEERHQTITTWHADLEAALGPPPAPAPVPTPVRPVAADGPAGRPGAMRSSRRPAHILTRLAVAAAVLVAVLSGVGAGVLASHRHGGPSVTTEPTGEGGARTVVRQHGITVAVAGPTAVAVGDSVRLSARVEGAETWTWVGPDGVLAVEAGQFEMDAAGAGRATVRLLAVDDHGRIVEATRTLRVT